MNISNEEQMLVKSGIDYSKRETMYEQTKASLKKFKSDCNASATNSFNIKTESVNIAYPRGRGGTRFTNKRGSFYSQRGSYSNVQNQRPFQSDYGKFRGKQNYHSGEKSGSNRGRRPQTRGFDSRPTNPTGPDGTIMRCIACDSILHLLKDCPHSYENSNSTLYVDEAQYDEEAFCLYTGQNIDEMVMLSTEAQNCAVLDSACSSTVCGKEWLNGYLNSLDENKLSNVEKTVSQKSFKFGGGTRLPSEGQYVLPAVIAGKKVTIKTDVVDSDIPLLLSKDAMKKACVKLDLETDTAEIMGTKINLNCTTSGHYCIPLDEEKSCILCRFTKC